MKKLTSLLLMLALILSLSLSVSAALTTTDALNILKAAAGTITLTAEQQKQYDLDGDGQITTADAIVVLKSVAGASGGSSVAIIVEKKVTIINNSGFEFALRDIRLADGVGTQITVHDGEWTYISNGSTQTYELDNVFTGNLGAFYGNFRGDISEDKKQVEVWFSDMSNVPVGSTITILPGVSSSGSARWWVANISVTGPDGTNIPVSAPQPPN